MKTSIKSWTNDVYTVIKRSGINKYDVLSSSFYSGVEYEECFRFTGSKKQAQKFVNWTGLIIN